MRRAFLLCLCLLAIAVTAGSAGATEVSRASYREAAEPICKANTEANERILSGVRAEVRQGKFAAASAQFTKAARALKATLKELRALPQPAADRTRLAKWLGYVLSLIHI